MHLLQCFSLNCIRRNHKIENEIRNLQIPVIIKLWSIKSKGFFASYDFAIKVDHFTSHFGIQKFPRDFPI